MFRVILTFKVNETGLKRRLNSSEHKVIQKDMQDISDPTGLPMMLYCHHNHVAHNHNENGNFESVSSYHVI